MTLKMLITDDDTNLMRLYAAVLGRMAGVSIDYAGTPAACRDLLAHHEYDLALFDIDLKDAAETGLDLLRHVKGAVPGTEVFMMSSMDDADTVARCHELGASGFASKNHGFISALLAKVGGEVERRSLRAG